jgi:integrase
MNRTARFWLPLLGLFTGARLNELCQLAVEDVKQEDGIIFLHITNEGEDQRVKTASGRRRIPLHSELLDLGFMVFVQDRRTEGSTQLFPELPKGKDGYFSGGFSKSFSRYLERIGIKTKKTSFHSLRHTFEDACRAATINGEIMDALQGHAEGGQRDRYGSGYPIGILNDALQRISYPSVDMTRLPRLTIPSRDIAG